MYKPIPNGTKVTIQGLDCWVPPVGMGCHSVTEELAVTDIIKRSENPKEQYWERQELPEDFEEMVAEEEEEATRRNDPEYSNPQLDAIREREWRRRLYGVWFYNNGKPTYITGLHYFFLNYWELDIGYPAFRIIDLEFYYFWDYCCQDPLCYGLLDLRKRRDGKCFAKDTLIRMYDGSVKKVQDIKDGEYVMGNDSKPRLVYGATSGREMMYKVIPNKGEGFSCNESHMLSLKWNNITRNTQYGWLPGATVNIPVKNYLKLKDWEKEHLVIYRVGWGKDFEHREHYIPPYLLGLYLGDGCATNGHISNPDVEIVSYVKEFADSINLKVHQSGKNNITNAITQKGVCKTDCGVAYLENWSVNPYRQGLKDIGVLKNKRIPNEYLIDSRENRLELLAGILDTDGHLHRNSKGFPSAFDICQKNKQLANDIIELARSLGFYVSSAVKVATMKRQDGSVYKCDVVRIGIYGELEKIPTRVKRKQAIGNSRRVNSLNTGFKIEPIGEGDYYGFAVDDNHLFLLADGTVVHNTYRGGCILYEAASRTEKAHCGMMQKKYEDARDEIYMKCVLPQFQQLPSFFRPTYDTAAGDAPVSGLRFFKPSKKGKKALESYRNKNVRELRSKIDYRETKVKSYDGSKLYRVFLDERAKVEIDVVEAHGVLKKCLENDLREVVGKMLVASTVEEIGIKFRYQRLWEMSDQYNREKTGKTKSGLYRFFIPADRSGARDIYGFPLKEKVRAEILAEREALEDNQTDLADAIRKEPLSVEEAFAVANKDCHYNLPKLNWQRSNLSQLERITQRGNFMWENATPFTRVVWEPNTNGRWEMPVGFSFSDTGLINNVVQVGSVFRPGNKTRFSLGLDPYDHDIVEDENRRSMAAALVLKKYDPMQPDDPFGKAFICKYHGRPKTATLMYDDILKTCWYFGCQVLYESNKPGIKKYFVDNNCIEFLVKIPGYSDYGIPSTQENKRAILDCTEEYIENYVDRVYFLSLIDDWIKFDVTKTQKFDLAMAAGWTLIAELQKVSKGEGKLKPITEYIRKHKIA